MSHDLRIDPHLPLPIYRQIVDQVRRLTAAGQLRPGDELPSVRQVAAEHSINPMTVSKAYSLLEAEGLLRRERGRGMVVADRRRPAMALTRRLELLQPAMAVAAQQARELEIPLEEAWQLFRRNFDGSE